MKTGKKLWNIIGFSILTVCIFLALEMYFFDDSSVEATWTRVQEDEEEIDVLILGNSHAYTSTNAALLSEVWGKNVECFGSSSSNMQEVMIHLEEALKYKKPQVILLEMYAIMADSRDSLKGDKLGVLLSDLDGIRSFAGKLSAVTKTVDFGQIPEGMFQLLRPTSMWSRYDREDDSDKNNEQHGFVPKDTHLTGTLTVESVEEKILANEKVGSLKDYNEEELVRFLEKTKELGIDVVLYKAPLMRASQTPAVNYILELASGYEHVKYCADYSRLMTAMHLTERDFYDQGHLNRSGAEKFTRYLAEDLSGVLDIAAEFHSVRGYAGEDVSVTEDGIYLYRMYNYDADTLYRYELRKDGEVLEEQDYSTDNDFYTEINLDEGDYKLRCYMKQSNEEDIISLDFMKKNDCVLEQEK